MQFDFYIMSTPTFTASQLFACQLAAKVYYSGYQINIATENQTTAQELDNLLWRFDATSFIPHGINSAIISQIDVGSANNQPANLLINMCLSEITTSHFQRILQIVPNDPTLKKLAREHYRRYQMAGHKLVTHHIKQ